MYFLLEILVDIVLALIFALFGWCIRHKNATFAILAVILMIMDVVVLYYIISTRGGA